MKLKLFILLSITSLVLHFNLTAQVLTAKQAVAHSAKLESVTESIDYLTKTAMTLTDNAERRSLLAFTGSIEEQMGFYKSAQSSYAQAASIAAKDGEGMPKKSSEQLVIDAVRCALSCGDSISADSYLNSAVRNSKDDDIIAHIKLYEQWSKLCTLEKAEDLKDSVTLLKTYVELSSMKSVLPSLLLTLWHITGEDKYAVQLKNNCPKTPEAAIVKGEIQLLPAPFWYFVPKAGEAIPEVTKEASSSPVQETSLSSEKVTKLQLGLFREESNAKTLCDKAKSKGFDAKVISEKRSSGSTYYLVVVDEKSDGSVAAKLRTQGFECYPLFD